MLSAKCFLSATTGAYLGERRGSLGWNHSQVSL